MGKQKTIWSCRECGHQQPKWTGHCGTCQKWNTLEEESAAAAIPSRFAGSSTLAQSRPVRVGEVSRSPVQRMTTGMAEVDRLLGGGIVPGSLTLLGGDPGIGKSTLMLQLCEQLAQRGQKVLYICGEESVEQTSLRAERLNVGHDGLYLLHETLFSQIEAVASQLKPDLMVIDSIQIVYKGDLPSSPGSALQVRELAAEFMHLAKGRKMAIFLIGHVTKSGEIAGPKVLEHIVDTVLDFEGDRHHGYRLLRVLKNRFGPTEDLALFEMAPAGLKEVANPSKLFLEQRVVHSAGSVIVPTVDGSRPILIEVQALVSSSAFSTSTRRSTGLDSNRLSLLLAVLEKRVGYPLHQCDVFVSVAGGVKIFEPALDLGIMSALASSLCNRPIDPKTAVVGEVGLGGEVRRVPKIESRIREAAQMGFERVVLPKRCEKQLTSVSDIELRFVDRVEEAIDVLVG